MTWPWFVIPPAAERAATKEQARPVEGDPLAGATLDRLEVEALRMIANDPTGHDPGDEDR